MEYMKVLWRHDHSNEPVWLYSELDENRWEIRKVEVFADGSTGFASKDENCGGSMLGLEPLPPMAEIAEDSQFVPSLISSEEFEKVWQSRMQILQR